MKAYDFFGIQFDKRSDAEDVLVGLNDFLEKYKVVTVAEFLGLCGDMVSDFPDNIYGWRDLTGTVVEHLSSTGKYRLTLPEPISLNSAITDSKYQPELEADSIPHVNIFNKRNKIEEELMKDLNDRILKVDHSVISIEDARRLLEFKQSVKPQFIDRGVTITQIPHGADIPEKPPVDSDTPAMWDLVIGDMLKRDMSGAEKYGKRLQAFNTRDALWDAYQECLDMAVYMRQAIYERDHPQKAEDVTPKDMEENDTPTDYSENDE